MPPETLLKSTVLMAMYSIRSERAFCERLNYDLLFKWFLDMRIDQPAFDATTFSKNRQRLLEHEVADEFFAAVVRQAKLRRYMSSEHFSVDGTLLKAWASHKSFKPKDGPPSGRPRDATSRCTGMARNAPTTPTPRRPTREARLYRKSNNTAATLCYSGHLLMEHRSALIVDAELTIADGYAERATAPSRCSPGCRRRRGDAPSPVTRPTTPKGSSPASARSGSRRTSRRTPRTALGDRRAHHPPRRPPRESTDPQTDRGTLRLDQDHRRRTQLRYRGRDRNRAWFKITAAVYNLIRITALDTAYT